jgi:hypothetical protein
MLTEGKYRMIGAKSKFKFEWEQESNPEELTTGDDPSAAFRRYDLNRVLRAIIESCR